MSENRLAVSLPGLDLKNPIAPASDCFDSGQEYAKYHDLDKLGSIMIKVITKDAHSGNPIPRATETPSGVLDAIGLQNPSVDVVLAEELPWLAQHYPDLPTIASVTGFSNDEYAYASEEISKAPSIKVIELNISRPNVDHGNHGLLVRQVPKLAYAVVEASVEHSDVPVYVKLTPGMTDIITVVKAVGETGTMGFIVINTLVGMRFNLKTRKPIIASGTGGMSDPAVFSVAPKLIRQVAQSMNLPVIGMGGVDSAEAAIEMMTTDVSAIGVGTASFADPYAYLNVIDRLPEVMDEYGIENLETLRHKVRQELRGK